MHSCGCGESDVKGRWEVGRELKGGGEGEDGCWYWGAEVVKGEGVEL